MNSRILTELQRREAEASAESFLHEVGWTDLPVDPSAIATQLGITVKGSPNLGTSFSGCLMLHGSTFGILYSMSIPSDGFQRFTVAHELGHYRLPGHLEGLFINNGVHRSRSDFSSGDWYELQADHFAASLLMPASRFGEEIRRHGPGRQTIKALAQTFSTSLTSTAIRYARLTPDPAAIIVSKGDVVLYCFVSDALRDVRNIYLPKGSPVPKGTITGRFNQNPANVAEAREEDGNLYLSEWFDQPATDFEVSEEVIGLGSYGRTLTVLHAPEIPEDGEDADPDHFTSDGKRFAW